MSDTDTKTETTITSLEREKQIDRVYFLTEVAYDAEYFNPEAYSTALDFIALDPARVGIILDGVWTRLDRPEILREKRKDGDFGLTFWNVTLEKAKGASKHVPSHKQLRWMWGQEFKNLKKQLQTIRERLPHADIVLSVDSDDTQHSIHAFLHEVELLNQHRLTETLGKLKGDRRKLIVGKAELEKKLTALKKDPSARAHDRNSVIQEVRKSKKAIRGLNRKMVRYIHELQMYREKKTRPMLQYLRTRYVRLFYRICRRLCRQYQVRLVDRQSLLEFGNLVIDYAHSRHATWAPIKTIAKKMVDSVHGLAELIQSDPDASLKAKVAELKDQAPKKRPDIIAASGHFGKGWKRLQKLRNKDAEMNFKNVGVYDPDIGTDYVTLLLPMPFEDQAKIAEFTSGNQPERMSYSKGTSSKGHAAFQRNQQGSVSGLTVAWKDKEGIVSTRWIQYQNFIDRSVLDQPVEYAAIYASSDEHLGSAEEMPMVRDGLLALIEEEAVNPFSFWGKPAYARGFISGGDTGEASSDRWTHRYREKRDPSVIRAEVIKRLATLDTKSLAAVRLAVTQHLNDALDGPVESMRDIQKRVRGYYRKPLEIFLTHSPLKIVHASVPGNHADEVFKRLGGRETDLFVEHYAARGVGVYESGLAMPIGQDPWDGVRIAVGGYSLARTLLVPEYGLGMDGKPLFGPISLLVHHDPKGSDTRGIVGTGKSAHADVTLSGHTHEDYVEIWSTGPNTFSVAKRLATMQGETATGIMYADTVPRTPAGYRMIMLRPGDFTERAIPASHLQKIGRAVMDGEIQRAMAALK